MPQKIKNYINRIKTNKMCEYIFNNGDLGICIWNISRNEMLINEKITGYELNTVNSMRIFLNTIAYEKDRISAIQDLDNYVNGITSFYESKFRIITKNGEIKWVLFKGRIFKEEIKGYTILYSIIFNITDDKQCERRDELISLPNRVTLLKKLKNSVINNELKVFYQPQVDALKNEIIGFEALIRWYNDKLGSVPPAEFIPFAENMGYITKIDDWVLNKVLYTASIWKEKGYKFSTIFVNVSPIQLKRNDFKDHILSTCEKYNISPALLGIEITERTLVEICKEEIELLNELIESGISVAIDDFGIGYSSLNYLIKLPSTVLKIDKSIIDNIDNYKNKAVISGLVNISKSLNFKIIAEGVETREQTDILTGLGCNLIQGYYFSKPLPEDEIEDLLKNKGNIYDTGG